VNHDAAHERPAAGGIFHRHTGFFSSAPPVLSTAIRHEPISLTKSGSPRRGLFLKSPRATP
jgi:hypothetical protein